MYCPNMYYLGINNVDLLYLGVLVQVTALNLFFSVMYINMEYRFAFSILNI